MGTRNHHIEAVRQGRIIPVQVGWTKLIFFYHKSNLKKVPDPTRLDEFKPWRVCAQHDSAASVMLQKQGIVVDPSNDLPSLFRKVAARRCDLGLAADVAIYAHLGQDPRAAEFGILNFSKLDVAGDILINSQHGDAQKLAREWRGEIEKMQKDGSLLKLVEKHFKGGKIPEGMLKFEDKQ